MNTIPAWVFIAIAVVGLIMTMVGSKKKKNGTALLGFLFCAAGVILFLCSHFRVFDPSAKDAQNTGWNAEAYGVAQYIMEEYPNQPVVIFGYLKEEQVADYIKTMNDCGISNVKYLQILDYPPVGVPEDIRMEHMATAMEKAGNAKLFIYRSSQLTEAYLNSDAFDEEYRFIQTGTEANKVLWDEGIVVASVKAKEGVEIEKLPKSPKAAFEKGYTFKKNNKK